MERFLIVCPLVFLAGFVDSIAGGGGLISFPAYMLAGVPVHVTLGTSKLSSFPGAIVATVRFAKWKLIPWRLALPCGAAAIAGALLGSGLALHVKESVIQSMMIVVLPIVAYYVMRNKDMEKTAHKKDLTRGRMLAYGAGASFLIGMYNGFYGPGTGTFLILMFTGLVGLELKEAAGISKFVNLAADVSAFSTFFVNGKVDYVLGITAAVFCMAGSYIGSGLVVSNGQKIVRPVVMTVLVLLFIKILMG